MVMLVSEIKDYDKYLDDVKWIGEIKRDGNRVEIHYNKSDKLTPLKIYNRKGELYSKKIPQNLIDEFLESMEEEDYIQSCVMDGELTYTDINGVDHRTQAQCPEADPILWLWDLQKLNGEDLRDYSWTIRKKELHTICEVYEWFYRSLSNIRFVPHYAQKRELLELTEKNNMEGIVLKNIDAKYVEGKVKTQIKIKHAITDDYIVIGYTLASKTSINRKGEVIDNKRYPYFKALVLAQYNEKGNIISKAMVGGGFTSVDKDVDGKIVISDLNEVMPLLDRKTNDGNTRHFIDEASQNKDNYTNLIDKDYGVPLNTIQWLDVNDWFIVEVKMQNLTEYGKPFQPRFLKLRNDKKIEECKENE